MRFFKPSNETLQWLVDYANGRFIFDIGAGTGELAWELKAKGANVICVEPLNEPFKGTHEFIKNSIQWLPFYVENCGDLFDNFNKHKDGNFMLLFARPCHGMFVESGIDILPDGIESLYITLPENLKLYNDITKYTYKIIKKLENESENEVICSIIK